MRRLAAIPVALAACNIPSEAPSIVSVTPRQGSAQRAQPVEIETRNFSMSVQLDYRRRDRSAIFGWIRASLGDAELEQVRWIARDRIEAVVPRGLPAGDHPLTLSDQRGRTATLADAFRIVDRLSGTAAPDEQGWTEPELAPQCRAETCNGADDDCDQIADDGCPTGPISPVAEFESLPTGSTAPDEWSSEGCAPDQVVVGFYGRSGRFVDRLGEHCGTPRIEEDASTVPHAYSLVIDPAPSAASRGSDGGTPYDVRCPPGQIVVGISGRSESALIDQLRFSCAEFAIGPDMIIREVPGTRAEAPLVAGGTDGSPFDLPCPNDYAVYRMRGALCCSPQLVGALAIGCRKMAAELR